MLNCPITLQNNLLSSRLCRSMDREGCNRGLSIAGMRSSYILVKFFKIDRISESPAVRQPSQSAMTLFRQTSSRERCLSEANTGDCRADFERIGMRGTRRELLKWADEKDCGSLLRLRRSRLSRSLM